MEQTISIKQLPELVINLQARVEELEKKLSELASKPAKPAPKEMNTEDAIRILTGDLKDAKHKAAAEALGLTYGQVYSCRLEFTFKEVHKRLANDGFKNHWVK